jgi:hypothetical protein
MAFYDQDHVITATGVVIWDGITSPDAIVRDGQNTGKFNHNLRIAVPAGAPENAELQKLVEQTLAGSTVQGVSLANPGNNPISNIDTSKFPELPGHVCFTAGTQLGAPPVVDVNGKELQAMQYGKMLYNGAKVKLLVHAYPYNNKQKGVNFGLDGIQIIDCNPQTAPRLAIGSAGMNASQVAGAFGGGSRTAPPVEANHQQQQQETGQYHGYTEAPPAPPADDAPPPAPVEWPPEGWKPNPNGPGWWYNTTTKEQLKEADLRARVGA